MADEPTTPTEPTEPAPAGDDASVKSFSRDYVQSLRQENASFRTRYQSEKQRADQREAQATEHASEITNLRRQLALSDVLHKRGLKPALTRAMLHTENLLSDLDPAAEDFADTLDSRVTELAAHNPELHENNTPTRSGAEFRGAGGSMQASQLTRADAQNMTPEQIIEARNSGRFDWILGRG